MPLTLPQFRTLIISFLLLSLSVKLKAQDLSEVAKQQDSISKISKVKKKSLFKIVWGDQLKTSFTAMPIGLHTDFEKHSSKTRSTINGLHEALYFAFNYKSIELAGFQNSFGDLTLAVFYKRAWNFTKRFSVNVGGGLMYGYDGRLQNTEGIPFRNTWLIKGDVNPVTGFELDYRFYKRWSIHTSIAPRIIIYGFRVLL